MGERELPSLLSGRNLIPKAENGFRPRQDRDWACWCVFNDKGEIVDIVTIMKDGSKGFSSAFGALDHCKLQDAIEMWRDLKACAFLKRIVNGSLLQ